MTDRFNDFSTRTLTLEELIEALEQLKEEHGGDVPVAFGAQYGDIGRTVQALPFSGDGLMKAVADSAYSHSGFAVVGGMEDDDEDMDEDGDDEELPRVLILL